MIDVGHHLAEAQAKELYWYDGLQTIRNSSRIPSSTQDTMHSKCRGPEGYIRDGGGGETNKRKKAFMYKKMEERLVKTEERKDETEEREFIRKEFY